MFCYFCQKNIEDISYKNTEMLMRYVSGFYKIKPRKKTGLCMHHQKKVAAAIKRARQIGIMPYTPK